jgi:hypothetical protein
MFNFRRSRSGRSLTPRSAKLPRSEWNFGRAVPGTFGAANRGRVYSEAEKRAVEEKMRSEGRLQ